MAIVTSTRDLEPRESRPIGWGGKRLDEMLAESERLFADTGSYMGLSGSLDLKESDPIGYEKLFSRIRGGLVSARETAMNISASPIVKELGELCFALYTPEGDSIALSTGIIVHVHTMSDAIKFMVRGGWEDNPGIEPGDIFANNDPTIGDVHNADVQTFVPIFDPTNTERPELLAWAGGVTHVLDIGAKTPGGVPFGPITRLDDGLDLPCMKIGQDDELAAWHLRRCETQTRAPMYYLLDEKTRLAGCHLIREAVERVILEEGAERFKQFSREVIEEGRRSFKARIREMTVPGRYRSPAFIDATLADKVGLPAQARRDFMMHSPFEVRIGGDGTYELDMDGTSAWGHHSFNCTPSAMQGAIWVQFTQTLVCNDKVNDGAYLALEANFPERTMANMGDAGGSTAAAWAFLIPAFTGFPRTLSRALQARGFIEEVIGAYACSGDLYQGGGTDQYGKPSAITHFELAAQGMGAKYVLDGTDHAAAMFNPEGDMGDVEMWELITPILYLSRRRKASSAGAGRHRGGSSHEALFLHHRTPFWTVQNAGCNRTFTSPGLFGGYPGGLAYIHNIRGADLLERARRGEPYPVCDGSYDEPELFAIEGEHEYRLDAFTTDEPIASGDLYLVVLRGGAGLGDPLLRPPEAVAADVRDRHLLPRFAESVYGVVLGDGGPDTAASERRRDEIRRLRTERAVPAREWWSAERERILAGELIEPIQAMLAESMKLSPRWAAEYRGFWDLDPEFEFAAATPTIPDVDHAQAGKVTPEEAADEFLAASRVAGADGGELIGGGRVDFETLAALYDEKLSRREVKDLQSSFKDPDRFDKWVALLQSRVPYDEPIVLPLGEGLNVVRARPPGAGPAGADAGAQAEGPTRRGGQGVLAGAEQPAELVVRCDCGHDFCAPARNWKLEAAVYVRDTVEAMREVYPKLAHADPEWCELREFYCPSCARQLDVEVAPPGYPATHDFLPDVEGFYRGWLGRELPS